MLGLKVSDVGRTCCNPMATVFGCPENIRVRLLKPTPRQLNIILKSIEVKDIHIGYQPIRDVVTGIYRRHFWRHSPTARLSAMGLFLDRAGAIDAQRVY